MGLTIGIVGVREDWIGNREEGRGMREEGIGKKGERVAEALEATEYDTTFLNDVVRVIKVNRVTRVNKVGRDYGAYRRKSLYLRSMPEALEGRGRMSNTRFLRPPKAHPIDINTADSLTWLGLKGIGPGFAHRILLFREKLGGFYSVSQLKEVYGLDSLWVIKNENLLEIGKGVFRKIPINRLEWKDFRHPYLPYSQVKIFLKYRAQHGACTHFDQLKSIALLDIRIWERMKPYLSYE